MHVVEPDGSFVSGGDALVRLVELLPGLAWLGQLARRQPRVRDALAGGYQAVAERRGFIGRFVPDRPPTIRRRRG
jgi:hypothetical protein